MWHVRAPQSWQSFTASKYLILKVGTAHWYILLQLQLLDDQSLGSSWRMTCEFNLHIFCDLRYLQHCSAFNFPCSGSPSQYCLWNLSLIWASPCIFVLLIHSALKNKENVCPILLHHFTSWKFSFPVYNGNWFCFTVCFYLAFAVC